MKNLILLIIVATFIGCGEQNEVKEKVNDDGIEGVIENPISETLAERVLQKDARLIGGSKSEIQIEIEEEQSLLVNNENFLTGYWVGAFGPNKINVAITEVQDGKVKGYSICAGNYRKLTGTVTEEDEKTFNFLLDEPGDNKYDGQFAFTIDVVKEQLFGEWTPFQKKDNSNREYLLRKREYKYDPSVGQWPKASQEIMVDADVENMMEDELATMRNEIYARHGYSFKNKEYRYRFEELDWYMPMGVDIRHQLTDVEVQNIDLIYLYESYLEEYYDDYGR